MRSPQLNSPLLYPPRPASQRRVITPGRRPAVDFKALLAERARSRARLSAAAPQVVPASQPSPAPQVVQASQPSPASQVVQAPQPTPAAANAIVAAAHGQIGGAYVWGGERPGAFDCSGLVRWAVRQATGQTLPRVAADQAQAGKSVARADLQPGDLVFFRDTNGAGISHVGIYAGEGTFIHAANERQGIITSRLDEPYWARHYTGARRVA